MNFKQILFITLIFLTPIKAYSIGFGQIHVYSKLNEPLNLEFELVGSKSINPDDIIIRNATKETYKRADLMRPSGFNRVKFTPVKKPNGSINIKVSSKKPIKELYITFIADLKWKDIQLNREYTFFLDPPSLVVVQKKTVKKVATQQPPKLTKTEKKVVRPTPKRQVIKGNYYSVQRGDTLSQIAQRARPDSSVTAHQTMNTIFSLNPKAFINNNINLLKQGSELTLPTKDEVLQFNMQTSKVAPNVKTPSPATQKNNTKQEEQINNTAPPTIKPAENKPLSNIPKTARLKIVPPSEELLNKPVDDDVLELMTKTLKTSHETITLLKKENELLGERIEQLTKKLTSFDDRNKTLSDKIDRINNLLEQQQSNPKPTTAITSTQKPIVKESKQSPVQLEVEIPVIAKTPKQQTFLQQAMVYKDLLIIILLGIIILFVLVYVIQKRNAKSTIDSTNKQDDTSQAQEEPAFSEYFDKSAIQVEEEAKPEDTQDNISGDYQNASEIELDLELPLEEGENTDNKSTTESTIREANTFIAYGKYDSAIRLLQDALEKSPEDKVLQEKLLELTKDNN